MMIIVLLLCVGVVMGFCLDWEIMQYVVELFVEFGVVYEVQVVLVYCMFDLLFQYVEQVVDCGIQVIIVGVGGVVYLLGMFVVKICVFVFGVLVQFKVFNGMDLLLLIVQMFVGILVGMLVIGWVGVVNVVLFVCVVLVLYDFVLVQVLDGYCVCQICNVFDNLDLCV